MKKDKIHKLMKECWEEAIEIAYQGASTSRESSAIAQIAVALFNMRIRDNPSLR